MLEKLFHYLEKMMHRLGDSDIEIQCYTKVTYFASEEWPNKFPVLPRVGDKIISKTGISLEVKSLEFSNLNKRGFFEEGPAHIRIELTLT